MPSVALNTLLALSVWSLLFILKLALAIIGLVWVPVCLVGIKLHSASSTNWELTRLPWWGHPFDNPRDGLMGDKRLHYWLEGDQFPKWFSKAPSKLQSWLKAYYWLAIRNPANNFSRFYPGLAVNVTKAKIELLAGDTYVNNKTTPGYQFVRAFDGVLYYWGFYLVTDKLVIRLGHKIEPKHITQDFSNDPDKAWKGFTFKFNTK